jgi:ribosomal protein S18
MRLVVGKRSKFTIKFFLDTLAEHGVSIPESEQYPIFLKLKEAVEEPTQPEGVRQFIAAYCDAFRDRYGTTPVVSGIAAGQAKNIVKTIGSARACELVGTYLKMNDSWFVQRTHDLSTFVTSMNKVVVKHQTGTSVSRQEANQLERNDATAAAFANLLRKA